MFNYFKKIQISYGVTVCDEAFELERLLSVLFQYKDAKDEIVVLQDITKVDQAVTNVIQKYASRLKWIKGVLNKDFATFKNRLINEAEGDFLFQIDADEVPHEGLLKTIKKYIRKNGKADCFFVPRINQVIGITEAYIKKWKLSVNEKGYLNFPDYQPRILKRNCKIFWVNKVHEELRGYVQGAYLPADTEKFCLYHIKDLNRQIIQNDLYDAMGK